MKTTFSLPILLTISIIMWCGSTAHGTITTYKNAVNSEPSLVALYTFDAGDASDAKTTYPGTIVGTVSYETGLGGGVNRALSLTGQGHIDLGQVEAFDFASGKGTVEAWIRAGWIASPGYNPALFADRDGGPVNWSIHMNTGKDAGGLWNGSSYQPSSFALAGTNWHHLAVVFDMDPASGSSSFTFYWDGVALGTTEQALGVAPESPTELGSASAAGLERWIGALDEVAFYSEALSAAAIRAHYQAYLVGDPPQITAQPQGGAFLAGIPLTLLVETKGVELTYQWFKDNSSLPTGTNTTLTLAPLGSSHVGDYQVIVANAAGRATSSVAQVQLGELPAKLKQYQNTVRAEPGLISYYTFDDLAASDSKNGNAGTPQGQVQYGEGQGGGAGKALVLTGAGHINLGVVSDFSFPAGKGTVEAWLRADWTSAVGYNPAIFANRDSGPVTWSIHINDAKDAAGLWNGSTYSPRPTPGAGTAWHHFAVVFDLDNTTGESSFTLYWDGVSAGSTTQGLGSGLDLPTQIGSSSVAGQERWVGAFDEVAFYSEALSADRIQSHYAAFITGDPPAITAQPRGGSFFPGSPLTLSVGVQGLDVVYQWFKNDSPMSGATAATLTFGSLTTADSAAYRVHVSNAAGAVDSSEAVVRVVTPNLTAYQQAVRKETSLISYYTFDTSDPADSKGSNHGSPVDIVDYQTGVGGGSDKTLFLDGNGHVDLGPVNAFNFTAGKGTVEAWVRADWTASPGYNPALFADRDGNPVNWSIHFNAGKDAGGLWNGSAYQPLPLSNTGTTWHHLAVVFDLDVVQGGNTFTLYWDGAAAGTTRQGLGSASDSPTELGSASAIGQERWIGALDEVAFYSDALTSESIRGHYEALVGATVQRPTLAFTRAGTRITLSWPANLTGFTLESSTTIPSAAWTPVPSVANNAVTIEASAGSQFYRLRQP